MSDGSLGTQNLILTLGPLRKDSCYKYPTRL